MLYRCCFLDADDNIDALEEIDVDTLLDAIEQANAMLRGRSHHEAIEVWLDNKCAYRAGRDRAA